MNNEQMEQTDSYDPVLHITVYEFCGMVYVRHSDYLSEVVKLITKLRAKNVEVESLRKRLEVDQRHPYDGIDCRDETIKHQAIEIDRLNKAISWEQNRANRIGTHGPGCYAWGHLHYECCLGKIADLRNTIADDGYAISFQTLGQYRNAILAQMKEPT